MRWSLLIVAMVVIAGCGGARADPCAVSASDLHANDALSFDDFDQKGTLPSSWRRLSDEDCEASAARVADDYAMHANGLTVNQQHDVLFHEAQSLAFLGDDEGAASLVAAARDVDQKQHPDLDWNTYLGGTWDFLHHDRPALAQAHATLAAEPGRPNHIDAVVLGALLKCFDRPYKVAYSKACR